MNDVRGVSPNLSYKQKHEQANREAAATVGALAVTIVVWAACGFGLSGLDATIFHTPVWVVAGTLGTWACAIAVSVVLAKRVFADFPLDDEVGASGSPGIQSEPEAPGTRSEPGASAAAASAPAGADAKEARHE